MAKTNAKPTVAVLAKELKAISAEWSTIKTTYAEDDPERELLDDDESWIEVMHENLMYKPIHRRQFPRAFSDARWFAQCLMCSRFAPWAHQVVGFFGNEQFPVGCDGPRCPESRTAIYKSDARARLFTGTDNTFEAGKRIILWGAAYIAPASYHREQEHRGRFEEWAREFVWFGGNQCRTIVEPMKWVAAAFEQLKTSATDHDGELIGYVLANELSPDWRDKFSNWTECDQWLKINCGEVPNKPRGRRRYVDAAAWMKHWAAKDKRSFENLDAVNPAELTAATAEYVQGAAERLNKVKETKSQSRQRKKE